MSAPLSHPIDEALDTFTLVNGSAGSLDEHTACASSLLNWAATGVLSDSLPCAHPLIRDAIIRANDDAATTADGRADIVKAGEAGALDTWWVPTEVVVAAMIRPPGPKPTALATCLQMLGAVAWWKHDRQRPDLGGANLVGADLGGANLRRANLVGADLRGANLVGANLRDANLRDANLVGANLGGAYGVSLAPGWEIGPTGRARRVEAAS